MRRDPLEPLRPPTMPRRAFMTAVAGGFLAAPLAAGAQPAAKVYHVGILSIGSDPTWRIPWKPFTEAMSELGYVEGRNLVIRPAFADGSPERLPALVAELVRAKVDAIVTTGPRETWRELEGAGRLLGITLSLARVSGPDDFDGALARAKRDGAAGFIATNDGVTWRHRQPLVQLALKHRLPAIYWAREYVEDGGLMTYSASVVDLRRRAAIHVDKILKGGQARRSPRRAADQVRAGRQPQDRQGPRPDDLALPPAAGG